jgi:Photosynthetic reaction centre cytochrome C subunit
VSILSLIILGIIITSGTISKGTKFKNLQVLPQDISDRQLDSIMDSYNRALRVSCDFCHVKAKPPLFTLNPDTTQMDFALDGQMKNEARKMIRLQIDINKKYFYFDSTKRPEYLNVVRCNTCHRGNAYPANE